MYSTPVCTFGSCALQTGQPGAYGTRANRVLCIFLLGASKIKDTHFPRCTYFASTVSPLFSNQRMTHWCTLCRRATFHTADCQMSQPFWFLTRLESLCTAEFTCRKVQIWAQPATLHFVLSIQLLKILPLDFDPPPCPLTGSHFCRGVKTWLAYSRHCASIQLSIPCLMLENPHIARIQRGLASTKNTRANKQQTFRLRARAGICRSAQDSRSRSAGVCPAGTVRCSTAGGPSQRPAAPQIARLPGKWGNTTTRGHVCPNGGAMSCGGCSAD